MSPLIFNDDIIQEVKERADIVDIIGEHVGLKRTGVNLKGLCPFHAEKTPSFTVNPSRRSYYCFGCNEGGDVFSFVMRYHNIEFPEALQQVASRYNIQLPEKPRSPQEERKAQARKELYRLNLEAVRLYHQFLLTDPAAEPGRRYLKKRGLGTDVIEEFQLGFAPDRWDFLLGKMRNFSEDLLQQAGHIIPREKGGYYDRFRNRILFPIFDVSGRALGFGGRALGDQQPKYLNSPESPVYTKSKILFGLFQNKEAIRKEKSCLLVEGNFDLLSLAAHGVRHVTAPLGTALTRNHVKGLKAYAQEVVVLFDGDMAGVKAALRAVPLFLQEQLPAKVVVLPEKHDPDTYISEVGHEAFEKKVAAALPLPEFVFDRLLSQHGTSLAGKTAIIEELKPIIAAIGDDQLQRSLFVSHFGQKLGVTDEQMLRGLPETTVSQKDSYQATPKTTDEQEEQIGCRLSKIEEQLLGFLVTYPEYLSRFMEAGLEYAVHGESAEKILQFLVEVHLPETAKDPADILDKAEGPERTFITDRLLQIIETSDEQREEEARETIDWLRDTMKNAVMRQLTLEISEAQQQNDSERLMQLLAKKNKLRQI